jgi:hypothetical protein
VSTNTANDPLAAVRKAETSAPNYDIDNAGIIDHLIQWQSLCSFEVKEADGDSIDIEFKTLPRDMDAFVRDFYEFCPDLVDQGTGCVHEMVEAMEEMGEDIPPEMQKLIDGVDFSDENYGLEILKRELEARKNVQLWWD